MPQGTFFKTMGELRARIAAEEVKAKASGNRLRLEAAVAERIRFQSQFEEPVRLPDWEGVVVGLSMGQLNVDFSASTDPTYRVSASLSLSSGPEDVIRTAVDLSAGDRVRISADVVASPMATMMDFGGVVTAEQFYCVGDLLSLVRVKDSKEDLEQVQRQLQDVVALLNRWAPRMFGRTSASSWAAKALGESSPQDPRPLPDNLRRRLEKYWADAVVQYPLTADSASFAMRIKALKISGVINVSLFSDLEREELRSRGLRLVPIQSPDLLNPVLSSQRIGAFLAEGRALDTELGAQDPIERIPAPDPSNDSPLRPNSRPLETAEPQAVPPRGISPGAGPFARRSLRLNQRAGPDTRTNHAIALGLEWLAAHQSPDGGWQADGFSLWCNGSRATAQVIDGQGKAVYDVGVTGLAVLAFLGAGYTNRSEGPFSKVVGSGLKFLREVQDSEGAFGSRSSGHFVYNHAIASLAMVEAYGMTGSTIYLSPAQKALDFIAVARNPYFAWRYGLKPGDNDTSITSWMFLALEAARRINSAEVLAGRPPPLTADEEAFDGAKAWIEKMTDPDTGRVGYQQRGTGSARTADRAKQFPAEHVEGMTAVGVFTRIARGEAPATSDAVRRGLGLIAALPPAWNETNGSIDFYSWRLCALAVAQAAGEPLLAWRTTLVTTLVDHQRADGDACGARGSWDPIDPWGADGGRVYSTATALLALLAPDFWAQEAHHR